MNAFHFRDSSHVPKRRRFARPIVQFSMRTMIAIALVCVGLASLYRMDGVSFIAGLGLLFALFMFAEDIWPKLPR
jgi:hypothetical protein